MNLNEARQILKKHGYVMLKEGMLNEYNVYIGKESQYSKKMAWYQDELEKYLKKWQNAGIDVEGEVRRWEFNFVVDLTIKSDNIKFCARTYRSDSFKNPEIKDNQYVDEPWNGWDPKEKGYWHGRIEIYGFPIQNKQLDSHPNQTEFEFFDSIIDNIEEYCNIDPVPVAEFNEQIDHILDKYKKYGYKTDVRNNPDRGVIGLTIAKDYSEGNGTRLANKLKGKKIGFDIVSDYNFTNDYKIVTTGYMCRKLGYTGEYDYFGIDNLKKRRTAYESDRYGSTHRESISVDQYIKLLKTALEERYKYYLDVKQMDLYDTAKNKTSLDRSRHKEWGPKLMAWLKSLSGDEFIKGLLKAEAQGQLDKVEGNITYDLSDKFRDEGYKLDFDFDFDGMLMDYDARNDDEDLKTDLEAFLVDHDITDMDKLMSFVEDYYNDGHCSELDEYDYDDSPY